MDILVYLAIGLPFGMLGAFISGGEELLGDSVIVGFIFWVAWPLVLLLVAILVVLSPFIFLFVWLGDKGR